MVHVFGGGTYGGALDYIDSLNHGRAPVFPKRRFVSCRVQSDSMPRLHLMVLGIEKKKTTKKLSFRLVHLEKKLFYRVGQDFELTLST